MHADNYRLYIADIEPPMLGGSICFVRARPCLRERVFRVPKNE